MTENRDKKCLFWHKIMVTTCLKNVEKSTILRGGLKVVLYSSSRKYKICCRR